MINIKGRSRCWRSQSFIHYYYSKQVNENSTILNGQYGAKHLKYDVEYIEEKKYQQLAIVIGFLCVQNCCTLKIFNKKYLKYIVFKEIDINENDIELLDAYALKIVKLIKSDTNWSINDEVIEFLGTISVRSLRRYEANPDSLIITIIRHCVYDKNIVCVEELRAQFHKMSILEHMQNNFELYEYILCGNSTSIDSETLIGLFDKSTLSIDGSNDGVNERNTIFYLNRFLRKCEQGEVLYNNILVTLQCVLEFLTGGNFIPFGGFFKQIEFDFYNAQFKLVGSCNPLPKSSTCNLIFFCPRNAPKYQSFENVMKLVVMECKEFGQV